MNLFDEFYYTEAQSHENYGDVPHGALDLQRLINGQPAWLQPKEQQIKKPKTLIITMLPDLDFDKQRLKLKLLALLNQGFSLYIYENNQLSPLTHHNIYDEDNWSYKSISIDYQENILQAARNIGLAHDNILMLDHYWNSCLIYNKKLPVRLLRISQLGELDSRAIKILSTWTPSFEKLIDDMFSIAYMKSSIKTEIKKEIPTLEHITYVNTLTISTELLKINIDEDLINELKSKGRVLVPTFTFEEKRFDFIYENIINVNFNGLNYEEKQKLDVQYLAKLLKVTTNLEAIDLSECNTKDLPPIKELSQLKLINLSSTTSIPMNLLNKAPNLEILNLNYCIDISAFANTEQKYNNLKFLTLAYANLSSKELTNLLKAAPNLEVLNLAYASLEEKIDNIQPKLNDLKFLDLNCSNISPAGLTALLNATPNLVTLDLSNCENIRINKENYLQYIDIKNLKKLTLIQLPKGVKIDLTEQTQQTKQIKKFSPSHPSSEPNIQHNVRAYKNLKPYNKQYKFEYKQNMPQKTQGKIINQLCQYLTINKSNTEHIPKMQNGICHALSNLYKNLGHKETQKLLDSIYAWDGNYSSLSKELTKNFETLFTYVKKYQFQYENNTNNFLGENTELFLQNMPKQTRVILSNPWHSVCIEKSIEENTYYFYDPNATEIKKFTNTKDLCADLNQHIGRLITSQDIDENIHLPNITYSDVSCFLAKGGLLTLTDEKLNKKDIGNLVQIINEQINLLTVETLEDGLLLRTTNGTPAWYKAKNSQIKSLTDLLLQRFQKLHENYADLLEKSVEELEESEKVKAKQYILTLKQNISDNNLPLGESSYQEAFSPWKKKNNTYDDIDKYCFYLRSQIDKSPNKLVNCQSNIDINNLASILVSQATHSSQPVFYINSPNDLICSKAYISRNDNNISLNPGPGGQLYDFLETCKKNNKSPLLVIDYTNFTANDIIRFNSILDSKPYVDGTKLPDKTNIIGLINTKNPNIYQGSDFYSRFQLKTDNPFPTNNATQEQTEAIPQDRTVINLFNAPNWKALLCGTCIIKNDQLTYKPGLLENAIKLNKPIEIKNGPWEDSEFQAFWQKLKLTGVNHLGQTFLLPKSITIFKTKGYEWENLTKDVHIDYEINVDSSTYQYILNQNTLSQFLGKYEFDNQEQKLVYKSGLIADSNANSTIDLIVTSELSDDSWALLLSECQKKNLKLNLHCAHNVNLPNDFKINCAQPTDITFNKFDISNIEPKNMYLIQSTDPDTTANMLIKNNNDYTIIDVSGYTPEDLMMRITTQFNQTSLKLTFSQQIGVVQQSLQDNKPLILKGTFSPELSQTLTDYIFRQKSNLIIVTDNTTNLTMLTNNTLRHEVSIDDKKEALLTKIDIPDQLISQESLAKLQARYNYQQAHPGQNKVDPWVGLEQIPPDFNTNNNTTLEETNDTQTKIQKFHEKRKNSVLNMLKHSPYVFLTGLTGVGKTTFVHNTFTKESNYTLFHEVGNIKSWATTEGDKNPILFLDEANLSSYNWQRLEGLFTNPPYIIEDGVYYKLTKEHKVIFAGNPSNYGGERSSSSFFDRHGSAILFEPLSKEILFEDTLKPLFKNQDIDTTTVIQACNSILQAYDIACKESQNEVLLSTRELQMMVLMGLQTAKNCKKEEFLNCINTAILNISESSLVNYPDAFNKIKTCLQNTTESNVTSIGTTFSIMPSQKPMIAQLQTYIALQKWRKTTQDLNDSQLYGGLGGLVFEGEPGIGKSELIIHTLVAAGYQENKTFYRISASMGLREKEELLKKAFNEGSIVIMDEINSSPMMEHTLNAMLMGRDPDTHKRPKYPGFMLIGSQNSINMAGRRATSQALQHRLSTIIVPNYTKQELCQILVEQKKLNTSVAEHMVAIYLERKEHAEKNHLNPRLCVRDLLSFADIEQNSINKLIVELSSYDLNANQTEEIKEKTSQELEDFKLQLIKQSILNILKNNAPLYFCYDDPIVRSVGEFQNNLDKKYRSNEFINKEFMTSLFINTIDEYQSRFITKLTTEITSKIKNFSQYSINQQNDHEYNRFIGKYQKTLEECKNEQTDNTTKILNLANIIRDLDKIENDLKNTIPYLKQVINNFKNYWFGFGWLTYFKGTQIEQALIDIPFELRGKVNLSNNILNNDKNSNNDDKTTKLRNALNYHRFSYNYGKETKTLQDFTKHLNANKK